MNRPATSPEPAGFFVLRTPLLPHEAVASWAAGLRVPAVATDSSELADALAADEAALTARVRALVALPEVRDALFCASPSLHDATDAWLADASGARGRDVPLKLARYLTRMASRSTPFGLFAGCSVGTIGAAARLLVGPRASYRRHTRLDMHYLSALVEALERDPSLRAELTYRPSTGLYRAPGQLRYAEARTDPTTRARSYQLVAVDRNAGVDRALARASLGARPGEIAADLVDDDNTLEEAAAFVGALIDAQVLVSDLAPYVTGPEPIRGTIDALSATSAGSVVAARLEEARAALASLDEAGLGVPAARYLAIAGALRELPATVDLARLFQVDLFKPAPDATLGGPLLAEILRGVELHRRIARPSAGGPLADFHRSFVDRYEGRAVRLVDALDDESGVGFPGTSSEPSPLLEGLAIGKERGGGERGDALAPTPRDRWLVRRVAEAARRGEAVLELDDRDLAALEPASPASLPAAFAAVVTVSAASTAALDCGEFQLTLDLGGPNGAPLLGRFCHGDPTLRAAVEAHLRAEEALRPDAVFAEVVHLPEGRLGNILCRPVLRDHEIAYLGRSGAPIERQLGVEDLWVRADGGRFRLFSERLGREVVPRMTTAHNHAMSTLGVYRFLCALQHDGQPHAFGFDFGLAEAAPTLPRVTRGRLVLSLARWRLDRDEVDALRKPGAPVDRLRAVRALREARGLPRHVALVAGDNVLPLDLESAFGVANLVAELAGVQMAVLRERFPTADTLVAEGSEGRFVHELVVPFVAPNAAPPAPPPAPRPRGARTFAPGSEWLYAKIHAGTQGVEALLGDVVTPLVRDAIAAGAADRWFFLRYSDPGWHLRLRLHGDPAALLGEVLPRLREALLPRLEDGRVTRLVLDTYDREIERYGGDGGIELSEALFHADSEAAIGLVAASPGDGGAGVRWRLALLGMHELLDDLGLGLDERLALLRRTRAGFAEEHAVDAAVDRQLGARFRGERARLEALIEGRGDDELAPAISVLTQRKAAIAPIATELRARARRGELGSSIAELAGSYLHMHANRVLVSDHRAQELVLYDFLVRLYESRAARAKARGKAP